MSPYDDVFVPIFGMGCIVAAILSVVAGLRSGFVAPVLLIGIGVMAFWLGLFVGSDLGYRAWQSIPNPPSDAFSDSGPVGALVFGWIPGSMFCVFIYALTRLARHLLSNKVAGTAPGEKGQPDESRDAIR